jgi:hypothetical protein
VARGRFVMQLEPGNEATSRQKHHQSWPDGRGSTFIGPAKRPADSHPSTKRSSRTDRLAATSPGMSRSVSARSRLRGAGCVCVDGLR